MEGQCIPTLAARPLLQAFVIRTLNVLRIRVDQNGVSDPGQETAIHMSKTNLKLSKSLHFLGHVYRCGRIGKKYSNFSIKDTRNSFFSHCNLLTRSE